MYPPILNCGYRNDKIVFDWTEYEPPIEDERRYTRNHKEEKTLFRDRHLSNELNGSDINERKKGRDHNEIFISKGGYGEIGRRYGLNWIEPWYGNLLSDNFQIQRNPGINKNGQS